MFLLLMLIHLDQQAQLTAAQSKEEAVTSSNTQLKAALSQLEEESTKTEARLQARLTAESTVAGERARHMEVGVVDCITNTVPSIR